MKVAPSILSCDFARFKEELATLDTADFIHVDVMDGVFVPNLTFGAPIVKSIKKHSNVPFDVHLMIVNPEKYIKDFAEAGSHYLTIHAEACDNVLDTLTEIRNAGMLCGVSIKPATPVSVIEPYLMFVDQVLVMSVEPGFGGQFFKNEALEKITELKNIRREQGHRYIINVDGGINEETAKLCAQAGADMVVAGSYIFKDEYRRANIERLRNICE